MTSQLQTLVGILLVACPVSNKWVAGSEPRRASAASALEIGAMIDEYCADCHNQSENKAGLDFAKLDYGTPAADTATWERVVRQLRHRQMPPQGQPRPDESTYDAIAAYLETELDRAFAAQPNPGRTETFRRLTRTEYKNAIRDLLALDVDVSSLLPSDESSHGFDNITVSELSPTLLERYLAAARQISRLSVGDLKTAVSSLTHTLPLDLTQEDHMEGLPLGTRGGATIAHNFPLDGEYLIQLRLTRDRNEEVEGLNAPHELELLLDGVALKRFTVTPTQGRGDDDQVDRHLELRIPIKAGPHKVAATFIKKSSALIESERQPYLARFNRDRHPRIQPALYCVTIVGPFDSANPNDTPSRRKIFTCRPLEPSDESLCATEIISKLMREAYRRPITESDLRTPLKFYEETKAQVGFEAGIEIALRSILVSPHFLFRIERDPLDRPARSAYKLSNIELASRLSFFLWSSIPDEELLDLAERGLLSRLSVLEQQVKRMLADPKSAALTSNFAAQWLHLRNMDTAAPDPRIYSDFDDNLRQSLRRETELFFASIVREDRSVLDLIGADYTFLNERLAKHYGIPHIYGSQFRRVDLDHHGVRGGLLSHGSILTVTSYANRTSPVLRGKWVLTNILGMPPAPPPPAVPQLREKDASGKLDSLRARIAEHRDNEACASCHNAMDPLGFALENFDAIGRWRLLDEGLPIDASGVLPDGSHFSSAAELRACMLKRPELFVNTLVEKLVTYSLGRGVEYFDAPAIRQVTREAKEKDFRFSALIEGIAKSTPFQLRNTQR